jgi:hypothetical protein
MSRTQCKNQKPIYKRKGFSWSMNEINRLHNEYELKELTVHQIAELHERGVSSILHKLASEGLISASWKDARGWTFPSETKAPQKTEKKSLKKKVTLKKPITMEIDEICDFTGSALDSESESESYDDSDEEYTLEDAQDDFDPYSFKHKFEFFESIIPKNLLPNYLTR